MGKLTFSSTLQSDTIVESASPAEQAKVALPTSLEPTAKLEVVNEVVKEVIKEVSVEVIKEVRIEVPVEVIKEVIKEVPVEVIKEIEVTKEVLKNVEIPVYLDRLVYTTRYRTPLWIKCALVAQLLLNVYLLVN